MTDPLKIIDEFFTYGPEPPPWPFQTHFDDYWGKKVAALAERCANAENELALLRERMSGLAERELRP